MGNKKEFQGSKTSELPIDGINKDEGAIEEVNKDKSGIEKIKRERVGILTAHFNQSEPCGPHILMSYIKSWSCGQVVRNESEIEALLNENAPLEVYYRDVNRTAKGGC